jgi:hypothetical protein
MSQHPAQLMTENEFYLPSVRPRSRRMLLLSPPVYDAQYWARWSQPAGLLRLASHLKASGYHVDLLDCMETDPKGLVPKARRVLDVNRPG